MLENLDGDSIDEIVNLKEYIATYLAHATIFLNGVNVLPNRYSLIPTLKDFYFLQDYELIVVIYNFLLGERKKEQLLLESLEDFSKTSFSRYFWSSIKTYKLNSFALTGIQGFENVALSYIQLLYLYYMEREERVLLRDIIFSNFKFIASFLDPKAVKKIEGMENSEKANAILRKRRDLMGRYGIATSEELVNQLLSMKSGTLDHHDMIIRREERADYESWKKDYIAKKESYNRSRGVLTEVFFDEEDLVKEYISIFRHSGWLLDEIANRGALEDGENQ